MWLCFSGAIPVPRSLMAISTNSPCPAEAVCRQRMFTSAASGEYFYGIVNQVADDVAEVRTVCREGKSGRLDVRRDMHGLLRLQFMLLDKRFENAFHGQRFRMQAEGLAAFHAHGEYLLDKSAEPLQLLLADAQILVALVPFLPPG